MEKYICVTCGVQYNESKEYPESCLICSDERQFVPRSGQQWTTLETLQSGDYQNTFIEMESGLFRIKTVPEVGIGQYAYLVTSEHGNILWDCITYLDEDTKRRITELGGISAIILSHPHYYSTIVEWAEEFNCPIYIHEKDQKWATRGSSRYVFWKEETLALNPEMTVVNLGGHFEGSSVLHLSSGSNGKGTLLVGDTIFMVPDQGWVSFMYSYPNRIPLPSFEVKRMVKALQNFSFEGMYGAFDQFIEANGKEAVLRSAERYIFHVDKKEI